jgi:ketosteroid isomerase-like protein
MPLRQKPPPVALMASPEDTEAQLYEALQQGDIDRLMAVWADDDEIACVHPGGPRLVGAAAIRASFESIFATGGIPVIPEQVHRLHTMTTAVHHLAERITITSAEGTQTAWVLATNVFLKTEQGWRLVVHHASPGSVGEQPPVVGEPPSLLH